MSSRFPQPCDVPNGSHDGELRFYVTGWKCDAHAPWAARGLAKPTPGPGLPATAWTTPSPINDSRVHDAQAIASGKRRSTPEAYRAAQAAINHGKGNAPWQPDRNTHGPTASSGAPLTTSAPS